MGMSDFYGKADDVQSTALLHHALDVGVNLFDTADMYGPWTNERLVGAALRDRRDQAVIATKFGFNIGADGKSAGVNSKPEHIKCNGMQQVTRALLLQMALIRASSARAVKC